MLPPSLLLPSASQLSGTVRFTPRLATILKCSARPTVAIVSSPCTSSRSVRMYLQLQKSLATHVWMLFHSIGQLVHTSQRMNANGMRWISPHSLRTSNTSPSPSPTMLTLPLGYMQHSHWIARAWLLQCCSQSLLTWASIKQSTTKSCLVHHSAVSTWVFAPMQILSSSLLLRAQSLMTKQLAWTQQRSNTMSSMFTTQVQAGTRFLPSCSRTSLTSLVSTLLTRATSVHMLQSAWWLTANTLLALPSPSLSLLA